MMKIYNLKEEGCLNRNLRQPSSFITLQMFDTVRKYLK